jgi:hypothetical protein
MVLDQLRNFLWDSWGCWFIHKMIVLTDMACCRRPILYHDFTHFVLVEGHRPWRGWDGDEIGKTTPAVGYAAGETLRSENAEREAVPLASDGKR